MFRSAPVDASRAALALAVLRVALAGLLAAHGWARLIAGGVVPFGAWLDSIGFPFGIGIASAVTAIEILGTPLLALRRFVFPLCCVYVAIYLAGLVLVHWPAGWFVVGLGRNGMEYSVLLIVCLAAVAWQDAPRGRAR
ncbi:DoxX family protein [Chiayiivirga flava]|uniref:Putative oxidoreductase n=1 Tax=Chiayiivirga flava TaxID=659595 RepID=A0A7W8G1L6_9GAMM|nr:DoxX family protein [Chiayiivirga flava]MBB5207770.1 putative oxidoreductase [Chiayiivirga flava]